MLTYVNLLIFTDVMYVEWKVLSTRVVIFCDLKKHLVEKIKEIEKTGKLLQVVNTVTDLLFYKINSKIRRFTR